MNQIIDVSGLPENDVEDIRRFVEKKRESVMQKPPVSPDDLSPDEWVRQFTAWVQSQPPCHATIDDSRESIYAGRGE
ncbi:MAG: hypothetical protein QM703_05090 [Gemmatales bacterium]